MKTNKKTKCPAVLVGEICLYGNSATCGAGWLARGEKTGLLGEPRKERSFTEAVWLAAEALRAAGVDGVIAIYAPGGERYAVANVRSVPSFGSLEWRAAAPGVVISAEQVLAAATAESRL